MVRWVIWGLMGLLCLSQTALGQESLSKKISVNYSSMRLVEVLKDLRQRYGYDFSYSEEEVPLSRRITVQAADKPAVEVFRSIFDPLDLTFQAVAGKIILKKGKATLAQAAEDAGKGPVTISGYIREKGSLETLPGASVIIPGTSRGTMANMYGFFSITLPEPGAVEFSMVGFSKVTRSFQSSQKVDIELEPSGVLQEVVVVADKDDPITRRSQMSHLNIPVSQIAEVPALLGEKDVFKLVQLFPGVQKGTEGSSGFYVRGGTPDQNLVILDDAVVYNANHLFGFFSIFNGDALKSVELFKGGFPARFGERLSSVMMVTMKDGSKEELKGEAGIGLISSRFTLEGPIQEGKSSFLISGRRTYADLLAKPFMKDEQVGYYNFYDLNAKIHSEINSRNRIFLSGYFGRDRLYEKKEDPSYKSKSGLLWGNATLTTRWNHVINSKMFSNTSAIFSNYLLNMNLEETTADDNYLARFQSGIQDLALKYDVDYFHSDKHFFRFGARSVYHRFTPAARTVKGSAGILNENSKELFHAIESNAYVEDDMKVGSALNLNLGFRISAFSTSGHVYWNGEPRFSANYLIKENLSAKASYSRMNQYIHLLSNTGTGLPTELWVPSTPRVKPQRSDQWAIGLAHDFPEKNLVISVEAYHKNMRNILAYVEGASFMDIGEDPNSENRVKWEDNVTSGRGKSSGIEFLIRKTSKKFSGWAGYTLSKTEHLFSDINNGKKFYPQHDRRNDLSLVGIYKKSDRFSISASWVYSTGASITIPRARYHFYKHEPGHDAGLYGILAIDYGDRGSYKTDDFHRLDISLRFTKQKKKSLRIFETGLYNAYNRLNPLYYDTYEAVDPKNPNQTIRQLKKTSLFPIIPHVSWTYKF